MPSPRLTSTRETIPERIALTSDSNQSCIKLSRRSANPRNPSAEPENPADRARRDARPSPGSRDKRPFKPPRLIRVPQSGTTRKRLTKMELTAHGGPANISPHRSFTATPQPNAVDRRQAILLAFLIKPDGYAAASGSRSPLSASSFAVPREAAAGPPPHRSFSTKTRW